MEEADEQKSWRGPVDPLDVAASRGPVAYNVMPQTWRGLGVDFPDVEALLAPPITVSATSVNGGDAAPTTPPANALPIISTLGASVLSS